MYVKISNEAVDQYPYTVGNLRRDNLNTSFPKHPSDELLADWGVLPVLVEGVPTYSQATQNVEQNDAPTLTDGVWTVGWNVTSKTSDEVATYNAEMSDLNRYERAAKLAETDFYALSDVTMSAEMTAYRQALRDITSHANWPHLDEADWPTKP